MTSAQAWGQVAESLGSLVLFICTVVFFGGAAYGLTADLIRIRMGLSVADHYGLSTIPALVADVAIFLLTGIMTVKANRFSDKHWYLGKKAH